MGVLGLVARRVGTSPNFMACVGLEAPPQNIAHFNAGLGLPTLCPTAPGNAGPGCWTKRGQPLRRRRHCSAGKAPVEGSPRAWCREVLHGSAVRGLSTHRSGTSPFSTPVWGCPPFAQPRQVPQDRRDGQSVDNPFGGVVVVRHGRPGEGPSGLLPRGLARFGRAGGCPRTRQQNIALLKSGAPGGIGRVGPTGPFPVRR